jgi:branched-chain amino acid transport system ATP-binding protein
MPMTADRPLLEVDRLTVSFGGLRALDAVSLAVLPGQVLGLIGPNGAGKTTLFNVVCGFVRPNEGEVRWQGRPFRRHRPHRLAGLGIARTLQSLGLFGPLTVLENVMIGAARQARAGVLAGALALPRSDRDERALRDRALAQLRALDIADVADRLATGLPYGVQKRVALARALVAEPRLLLLDEPASGLSAEETRELADLVRGLRADMSVMLVEHHVDLVMSVCDAVVVLDFGKVIAAGAPDTVRTDPAVVDAYLGTAVDDPTEEPTTEPADERERSGHSQCLRFKGW